MKILVTGGAGFIGSHLCDRLIEDGHEVTCLDNLRTGSLDNLSNIRSHERFQFVNHDTRNPLPPTLMKFDEIYHLASLASPTWYSKYPLETALVNSVGTLNVLNHAMELEARVLLASTSEVYGFSKEFPQKEDEIGRLNPMSERACYAESKRFAETLCSIFQREYDLDVKVVRIFNTYGPRMRIDDGRVIPTFIGNAIKNEPLPVFGDGKQTRSFCYISDMVEGILTVMKSETYAPINLGNPNEEIPILDLANVILKLTESSSKIEFLSENCDETRRRCPDISYSYEITNWGITLALIPGIERTIEYYRNNY